MTLLADIEAEPAVEDVDYSLNGSALLHSPVNGVVVENKSGSGGKCKLQIDSVTRKHCGKLTLSAMNCHGKGSASINLKVQGIALNFAI